MTVTDQCQGVSVVQKFDEFYFLSSKFCHLMAFTETDNVDLGY